MDHGTYQGMAKHAGPHNAVKRLMCRAVFLLWGGSVGGNGSAQLIRSHTIVASYHTYTSIP